MLRIILFSLPSIRQIVEKPFLFCSQVKFSLMQLAKADLITQDSQWWGQIMYPWGSSCMSPSIHIYMGWEEVVNHIWSNAVLMHSSNSNIFYPTPTPVLEVSVTEKQMLQAPENSEVSCRELTLDLFTSMLYSCLKTDHPCPYLTALLRG